MAKLPAHKLAWKETFPLKIAQSSLIKHCIELTVFSFPQLEVHEAKPIPENHPQWDTTIEGDDDQGDSEGFEESYEEEEEDEEDD